MYMDRDGRKGGKGSGRMTGLHCRSCVGCRSSGCICIWM